MSYPAWLRRGSGGSGPILHATRRCWDDSLRSIDLNFRTRHFLSRTTFSGSCHCSTGCVRTRSIETRPRGHLEFFAGFTVSANTFFSEQKKRGKGGSKTLPRFAAPWCTRKLHNPFCSGKCGPQTRREAGSITAHTKPSRNEHSTSPPKLAERNVKRDS